MRKAYILSGGNHGAFSSTWSYVPLVLFGLLCIFGPQSVECQIFECPTNCTCNPWRLGADKVQNISCAGLGLTQVPKDGKEGADVIVLDLSNNNLTAINATDLQNFENLDELDLSYNKISSIAVDVFTPLTSLQYLDISNMLLTALDKDLLKDLDHLKELYAQNNLITDLDSNVFRNSDLEIIDLSYNEIATVDDKAFNDGDVLTNLSMDHNKITSLDQRTFDDLSALQSLTLNNNLLTSLHKDIFHGNTDLENVDLSYNSLTTIPDSILDDQTTIAIKLSNNPFVCECTVRDFLYELKYDLNKELLNEDSTNCTVGGQMYIYVDWDDATCSGNLGSNCAAVSDCMVRDADCVNNTCVCKNYYYDNNLDTVPGGQCKPKLDLGGACTMDSMCKTNNSECTGNVCMCLSTHYDDNNSTMYGGECLPKLSLYTSCNESYQCASDNSECSADICICSAGYYDFSNTGNCQAPEAFYSCYPDNTTRTEVHFSYAAHVTTMTECEELCFIKSARYHRMEGATLCICGNVSESTSCCPKVEENCNGLQYLGNELAYVTSGMNVTSIPQQYNGIPHQFSVSTNLSVIDQIKWHFGDSEKEEIVDGNKSTVYHTYTHSRQFTLTISACNKNNSVCDDVEIPVRVQVPPENLTTWITGYSKADVSKNLSDIFATFTMGQIEFSWQKTSNGVATKKRDCSSGWTAHRHTCIKLVSAAANYTSASSQCTSDGGKLLQINFVNEIAEIVTTLSASSYKMILGAERVGGVWQWKADGSKTFFSDTDLQDSSTGDCLILDGTVNTLTTISCSTAQNYVCMTDPVDCPLGGELQSNGHCLVLSTTQSLSKTSWEFAQTSCVTKFGGWLANITDSAMHTKITSMLTSASISEAWFGLSDSLLEGYYLWADGSSYDYYNPPYQPSVTSNFYDCFVTTNTSTWQSQDCDHLKDYVCQYSENNERATVPTFVTGTQDLNIASGANIMQTVATDTFTNTTLQTEVWLFPGMWFTREGSLRSWNFHSVAVTPGDFYDVSLQVYRPTCTSPQQLVQAGCGAAKFATCSSSSPSCTAASNCSSSQSFCYLSNTCKQFNQACTCTSETASTYATTACASYGTMPTYSLIAQIQFTTSNSGENYYTVPAGDTPIQEHDVVGIQFPLNMNIIKCEDLPSDLEQQEVYSNTQQGWLHKFEDFPTSGKSIINRKGYFQMISTQDMKTYLPQNLGYSTTIGDLNLSISIVEGESKKLSLLLEESIEDVKWVYPEISVAPLTTSSLGTVYTEWNKAYDFTLLVKRGNDLTSQWSFDGAPGLSIIFGNVCTTAAFNVVGQSCNASLFWSANPFAYSAYNTSAVGSINLDIVITNGLGSVAKTLIIQTEKKISGVSFSLVTPSLIANNVAINRQVSFSTLIADGTAVSYSYTIDSVAEASNTSELNHTFSTLGTYIVEASVTNILGTEKANVTVYAKTLAEFANCIFIGTPYIAATNIALDVHLQCDVTVGAEVSAIWMLSDGSANVTTGVTLTATATMSWQHSVTFTSAAKGTTITAIAQDPFEQVTNSTSIDVYNAVPSVNVAVSDNAVYSGHVINFTATVSSSPGNYGTMMYTFDFGDGTMLNDSTGVLTHSYTAAGNYTVTVTASNGPSIATSTKQILVFIQIDGLSMTYNGPKKITTITTFSASISAGNFENYRFLSTVFDTTQASNSFSFNFTTAADYNVTVICSNSLSQQTTSLTAYIMNATDVRIVGLKINNTDISGCIESGQSEQYSVEMKHYDEANLKFDWDFGDGSTPQTDVNGIQSKGYTSAGNFTIALIAKYPIESSNNSINKVICVQERIASPVISVASPVTLPASGTLEIDVTVSFATGSSIKYTWSSNATIVSSLTSPTFQLRFTTEGFYQISVNVSNEINSELVTKVVQVGQEISGLSVNCPTCRNASSGLYVTRYTVYSFYVSISTGTIVSYSWTFGDGATGSGLNNTHTYTALGKYNLTVVAVNIVGISQTTIVVLHVEELLTGVSLSNSNGMDWGNNIFPSYNYKTIDITKTVQLFANTTPAGMELTYSWEFDTGSTVENTTSSLGIHNYTSVGMKSCKVTAINTLNYVVSSAYQFYVIQAITSINMSENGNTVALGPKYKVAVNKLYTVTVTSSQIVDNTVTYFFVIRKGSNLKSSSTNNTLSSMPYTFTEEGDDYQIVVLLENRLGKYNFDFDFEAILPISDPYITPPVGADGNITLFSSIELTGGATTGKYPEYTWSYAVAPNGQTVPSGANDTILLTLTEVGLYIVNLQVYNSVSDPQSVNYTINVMVGVSGVDITYGFTPVDAVSIQSTHDFTALVGAGTELSYLWEVSLSGFVVSNGTAQSFSFLFGTQALYNITLVVNNYASSGTAFREIYSLNDVPQFNVTVTPSSYVSSISKYAVTTGDSLSFASTIPQKEFLTFSWTIDGTLSGSTDTLSTNFTTEATHIVTLEAANKIGNQSTQIKVLVQIAIENFLVVGCVDSYMLDTDVTLTAMQDKGSDIGVTWDRQGYTGTATGQSTIVKYSTVGVYSVNVTGNNYVSSDIKYCILTILGEINNLQVSKSQFFFVGHAITFTITGDYISPATFEWIFSHGHTETTSVPNLDLVFAAKGNYTFTVVVTNDVSSKNVTGWVEVEDLKCSDPVLMLSGSSEKTTIRARAIQLVVTVTTSGCVYYSSVNKWTVYKASSCMDSLTTEYTLASNVSTNTPNLVLPTATLEYGTYCIRFEVSYAKTPVVIHKDFNVTIEKSDLVALISGGDVVVANAGTTLTLDASTSHDPDQTNMTTLSYTWACTQTLTSSAAVCSAVNAMTTSSATLTGLNLTSGDVYTVTVTVAASGRTSGSATQQINILSAFAPVVSILCQSCIANSNYFLSNSNKFSSKGTCISGCTNETTYQWTVTKVSTNSVINIDSLMTTTGTQSINFAITKNLLENGQKYEFRLTATTGSYMGYSSFTLLPGSVPSGGTCSVSPTNNIVPLQDLVTVSCINWQDADPMSGLYYKIVVSSATDEYIVYSGPRAENHVYLSPWPNTSPNDVNVKVYVLNDYGVGTHASTTNVGFTAVTLSSGQSDNVDYIIDKMAANMKSIVKQNNPALFTQYCISVLNFLNDQSATSTGTVEKRMAVRWLIAEALLGLPRNGLADIKQRASAIWYLSEYPEEMTNDTLSIISTEIEAMLKELNLIVRQGHDQTDFQLNSLLNAVSSVQEALRLTRAQTPDSTTLTKFGNTTEYLLEVSSKDTRKSFSSIEMSKNSLIFSRELVIVQLKTQLANEQEILETTSDGSIVLGLRASVDKIKQSYGVDGVKIIVPSDILTNTSNSEDSVFQIISITKENALDFGYSSLLNTKTLSCSFHKTTGDIIPVSNLTNLIFLYFAEVSQAYDIADTGLVNSAKYNPIDNVTFSVGYIESGTTYSSTIELPSETNSSISIPIRPDFDINQSTANLTAVLLRNEVPYGADHSNVDVRPKTITYAMMQDLQHDHRDYTFFVSDVGDDAFKVTVTSTHSVNVSIGTYYAKCVYFNTVSGAWMNDGCVPLSESIPSVIKCGCNHMTSYGGSLLVSPDQIDFTDLTEIDFAQNPVAIITCSVVLFLYIVVAIYCRRMDILDVKRISLIPLCGKDGSFKYEVTVVTGRQPGAATSSHVGVRIIGEYGKSARQHISKHGAFQRCCSDTFIIAYDVNLGDLRKILIWHDNSGMSPSWYLSHVIINDMQTDQKYYFFANTWLSLEVENGTIQKEVNVAGAEELNKFSYRMKTAMFNALADKHLWLSLLNRPAQSRFTRFQRITCCVTLLYTFIGVNAMWYGLLKTDNTSLSFGDFGWEEIILAIVSNLMVFPINMGIVFLFKKSRSKSNFFDRAQKPQTAQTLEIENLCGNSQGGSFESQNTGAVPYDLERESTMDSVPHNTAIGLHRSRHVAKSHREKSDDSLYKQPRVAVTHASAKAPLWNEENIMKWPESMSYDDGTDSRPSTGSTVHGQSLPRQPPAKAGGSTPGATRKSKTLKSKADSDKLLEDLDQMEHEFKEVESKSVRSGGSRRSSMSLRKPSMHKSNWGSLEDILHSDDESVAESGKHLTKKRGSTTSQSTIGKQFNPRSDPRIHGNGTHWPKSRESIISGTTDDCTQGQSGGITAGIRPGYYNEMTMESHDIRHIPVHKEKCTLPSWCVYIAYTLCFLLSVFSVIIVILYCFTFGYYESLEWVLASLLSLILSICVIEPLKALLIAVYVLAVFKNIEQEEEEDYIDIEPTFDNSNEKIKDVKFKPISGFALMQAKEEGCKIHRMNVMIRQFVTYVFYLWLLMVIVYVNFHYNSYLLNKHVEHNFVNTTTSDHVSFKNISSIDEFWDWTENVFIESLHIQDTLTDEEHGYLLGPARIRLIRSTSSKCEVSQVATRMGASSLTDRTCYGDGGFEEDTNFYGERWNESSYNRSWKYNSASQLGGSQKIGHVATYNGGGYTQILGTSQSETLTIIQDLKEKGWIDLRTRAVIFEFSIYSAGSDMTAMSSFLAEFPLTGGVITSFEIQSQKLLWFQENKVDPLMVLECILLLITIYSLVHIVQQIRTKGKEFFKQLWNWYEMLTTVMTIVAIGMYIGCVVEATNTFNDFLDNQTGFTNFERVAYVHVGMRYLHAWLLFLLMYKVVKQLRFIKFMYIYVKTLSSAVSYLLGTGLIYVILLLMYAQLGYLMYGRVVAGFESVGHSITTLIVMIRGTFDFWPMLDHQPIFSHFYVYSYYAFVYGIMVALVIAILTSTYRITKSKMYYRSTLEMQDYEMIDFMMKRFKLWAGIQKPKPAFRHVRFPGLPSISSRSSSSYSNRSSESLHSSQSISCQEYNQVQLNSMLTRLVPTWQAVLRRFEKIEALDMEEENLVNKAENELKDLNWKCRINELERQHKELLKDSWQPQPSTSNKPPMGDAKQRQSILKRLANREPPERKAPATVSGSERSSATPPAKDDKIVKGKRPLSDQGARNDQNQRTSTPEKSKIQKFFKSVKPSKSAWNK